MSEFAANRLASEKSPYLLQHAHNPVDWYPWGEEAFNKAREEDKPIFLSIGYSTCHWCHVMEKESFEDAEVARLMNEAFVSIKVDREERPDIDNVYMAVAQAMTGRGGWPLTIVMTAEKKPFFSGTYFPKHARGGQIGMLELTSRIKDIWLERRQEVYAAAEQLTSTLNMPAGNVSEAALEPSVLHDAFAQLAERFDSEHGGFGREPKFPTPHTLSFLLRYWKRSDNATALRMAEATLRAMRAGGIYDHVGYGFHRYSTDREWLVPHFEKMLYDQALLAMVYLEAYQETGNTMYADTAREIFTYVLRDMLDVGGAFYSAEDADSEGEEGKFYVWTQEEISAVLGEEDAALALKVFDIQPAGNFSDSLRGGYTGANIPHFSASPTDLSAQLGVDETVWRARVEDIRSKLFARRAQRVRPHLDDKIIADWNGLMIAALALGAQVLDEPLYAEAAAKAADFVLATLRDDSGRLAHRYREGEVLPVAYLDDYAFLVWGLLELYEATFVVKYLRAALRLNAEMLSLYWDDEAGALFLTPLDGDQLIFRPREAYDGAVPSGNSVAALNLIRLARLTGAPELEERASRVFRFFSPNIKAAPVAHTQMLQALDFAFGPSYEVVIAGDPLSAETKTMLRAIRGNFLPNKVLLLRDTTGEKPEIVKIAGFAADTVGIAGRTTAYVCQDFACKSPTSDVDEMLSYLS